MSSASKIVVMIDGDNFPANSMGKAQERISQYGTIVDTILYGDFSKSELKGWSKVWSQFDINVVHVESHGRKQATDMYMIADGALMVANNSEFTHLAIVSGDQDLCHLANAATRMGK
jgi:uncharacterized LabA/DUF88 family protein